MRAAWLILVAILGCGGGSAGGRLGGTTPGEIVEAPAEGAPRYTTGVTPEPAIGGLEAEAIARGVAAAARAQDMELLGDGRLGLLAAWTAEQLGEGGAPPPHDVVEFFTRHLGLVEPVPHLLILGQPDASTLEASIEDSVTQFLTRQPYNRWGAVVVPRQGLTLAVVILSTRWLEMDALPRRLEAGEPIRLRGRLLGEYQHPTFAVAMPDGSVERRNGAGGREFDITLPTTAEGEYKIEILAQGPHGDTVMANFPLYVGVDVPSSVQLAPEDVGGGEAEDVSEALFRLMNQTRREAGLRPLELHTGLASLAEAHSRDMVEQGFVGHTSPTTGDAPARVRSAGYRSGLVLENIGRGYSPTEIHRGLLASPGHRANILNPDVTHVGVGVVAEPEGQRTAYVATEVFIRMAQEIDVARAPGRLLEAIGEARRARGVGSLEADENLSEAAQRAAEEYFADPEASQQGVVDRASASLRRFGLAWSRVGGLMAIVTTLEEASQLEPTFDPDARFIGIGIAQGTRPDHPPNSIAVVILMAWPR